MDPTADSDTRPLRTTTGGHDFEHEMSFSYTPHEMDDGISLQVLKFKTCLLEAVEELHIHREAELRYEEQISKLVLEKQELEWQKESLQHQIDTIANQHTEALANVKKQFQDKLRGVEGEKGKHQLSAELKDMEINSLKEELKLLQLFKYSLEKKLSELEQKLQLQTQTKDSHLNQLGEVEKRFGALSRQCTMIRHTHEKLEKNVEDAMRLNKTLTSVNRNQESKIISLKQNLEELSNKLIKAKVSHAGRSEKNSNHTVKEQQIQQLQHRLHVETEMNKKLRDENSAERADKREVMNSLQHAQQLLLIQTQAVAGLEQELNTRREQFQQALKREQEVMRERERAEAEEHGRFAQLQEEHTHSRVIWENEKLALLERIQGEQQDLRSVREAYDHLHQEHREMSSQATLQAEPIQGLQNGLENLDEGNQNPTAESRELSIQDQCDSGEVPREVVGVEGVEPAVESQPAQEKAHDESSVYPAVPYMESQSEASPQTASSQVTNLPQTPSVNRPHCSDAHPEGPREEGSHSEAHPSPQVPRPGCAETLAPSQSGGSLVVTDSLLTEAAAVVDALTRPICGATGGQPDESNTEHTLNPSPGQSRDPHAAAVSGLIDNDCVASDVLSGQGGVMIGLSGSGYRSVYGREDVVVSGSAVEGTKDEEGVEEGRSVLECSPDTTNPQTSGKSEDRGRGASSSPLDIVLADAEAPTVGSHAIDPHTVLQRASESDCATSPIGKGGEVRIHSDDELALSPDRPSNTRDTAGVTSHAQAQADHSVRNTDTVGSGETSHDDPVRESSGTVSEEAPEPQPPMSGREISPENGRHATVTADAAALGLAERPSEVVHGVDETGPLRSPSATLSPSVDPPAPERFREDQRSDTVAVDKTVRGQHADGDQNDKAAEDKSIESIYSVSHPAIDEGDISPKSCRSDPTDHTKAGAMQCGDTDESFLASKKRLRSSFEWTPQKRDLRTENRPDTPDQDWTCASPVVCDPKTRQRYGLSEPPSPFPIPGFLQGRQGSREFSRPAEALTAPSLYPPPRRDQQGEWNAIRETFGETSTEKESRVHTSHHYPTTSRLSWQQNHHSSGRVSGSDLFPSSSQENGEMQHSDIRAQIAKIEHFLCSERLRLPKRRRMDD